MLDREKQNRENCIAACAAAIAACQACAAGDIRAGTSLCALINLDCIDICTATMNAMARGSEHHGDFCTVCAHICRACATACAAHAQVHEHCAVCMRACEHCASECMKHAKERHL
ncbi:four-helix bundle copper-binding protein [Massilia sp. R2A-15]|uniref:four-helix bundle copper-binding protein n=1 Tax=Massilia sp. R2A-15 TaxID=3064278 RepID=UPI0027339FC3|nr:four-helix bundle copper-binding protein [Massilia sp. R2A-15]WLI91270.1 four-helix bundle copper-binding protein [Massilia sp. R2A-15]